MGKEAKAKAPKDPNAPKKPLGAYMLFSKDMRKVVMEENPSAGFGEVGKILGAKWKECDEKTKKKYTDMAEVEKKKYEQALSSYKQ